MAFEALKRGGRPRVTECAFCHNEVTHIVQLSIFEKNPLGSGRGDHKRSFTKRTCAGHALQLAKIMQRGRPATGTTGSA